MSWKDILAKALNLVTGGIGGTAAGVIVGGVQVTVLLSMAAAAWLWTFENRETVFMVVKVSDLFAGAVLLAIVFGAVWLAGRTRPRDS